MRAAAARTGWTLGGCRDQDRVLGRLPFRNAHDSMPVELTLDAAAALVNALRDPRAYPHPAADVALVETHISWVLLAGQYAYKLKKPLDLGFLDFSTAAKRRAACEEEVRLNRRLAPELYLGVVAIVGPPDAPRIGEEGPVLDSAVRMRRFDRSNELDRLLERGKLPPGRIQELAEIVARFHGAIDVAPPSSPWGMPAAILASCLDNFAQIAALEHDGPDRARLAALRDWTLAAHARLASVFEQRRMQGFVRECHGDLHLANIVLHEGRVVVFDCIEFNPRLRWIDVASEIAFTIMDLRHRGRRDYAQRFLDAYLVQTGDYDALSVLTFYLVYRAMVRAKVAAIRAGQEAAHPDDVRRDEADFRAHLGLAEALIAPRDPGLVITHGVAGSGKSSTAAQLLERGDWVRLRSDVERKRLAGLPPLASSRSGLSEGLYAADATERTYARLADLAERVVRAGFPVIVDAAFLERDRRRAFHELAARLRVPFAILSTEASHDVLRARVASRAQGGADPSEATLPVLERQLAEAERLDAEEARHAVRVDTERPIVGRDLAEVVRERLERSVG